MSIYTYTAFNIIYIYINITKYNYTHTLCFFPTTSALLHVFHPPLAFPQPTLTLTV